MQGSRPAARGSRGHGNERHQPVRGGRAIDGSRAPAHARCHGAVDPYARSEEHTSELQSLMRISYAVFCLKKKKKPIKITTYNTYPRHKNQLLERRKSLQLLQRT